MVWHPHIISGVILGLVPRIQRAATAGASGEMDGRDTRNESKRKQADHDNPGTK